MLPRNLRLQVALFVALAALIALPQAAKAQVPSLQKMGPELHVQVRLNPTGDAILGAWSSKNAGNLVPLLPEALGCQSGLKADENGGNAIRCSRALTKNGLALESVLDLAPIARQLDGSAAIELWVSSPRLGFETSSAAMNEEIDGPLVTRTVRFEAGVIPAPIKIKFGYEPAQLAGIYLPLLALAVLLTLSAALMSRAGFAGLALSAVLLGTMLWMCASAQFQADVPVRILLFGNPLANYAALFIDLWPPLFCVAIGVAIGSRMRVSSAGSATFGQVVTNYAVVPLILTSVVGALPLMGDDRWFTVACWLAAAPLYLILRRARNRSRARSSVRLMADGELWERVKALASGAGWRQAKLYISFSTRTQIANAFALPGKSIFLTAPLVQSLSKREVDAVVAHELSHSWRPNQSAWTALLFAMLLCETPVSEFVYLLPGGLFTAIIVPIAVFLGALYGSRKREFAADAYAAALTRDPQAMISSLARVARNNNQSLHMNPIMEWFSSHPSTRKRISILAAAARLNAAEVESLSNNNQPGEPYAIPSKESAAVVFSAAWQQANAGIYSWGLLLGSSGAGLLVAWLLHRFAGYGILPILCGIVLGCAFAKFVATTLRWLSYARLRQRLNQKLGVGGRLVGLAMDSEARVYGNFRFTDAGLLRFHEGRLCYQSECVTIALNPADVFQIGMVAAAPSNWFRRQPMVQFRNPESGQSHAFILHTLDWLPTQRKLLRAIESWRATAAERTSPESTIINGFNPVAGQQFRSPAIAVVARAFPITGGITLLAAIVICFIIKAQWQFVAWALVVTACAFTSMLLPAMLYRPASPSVEPAPHISS